MLFGAMMMGFNRTFMELKFFCLTSTSFKTNSFNRTFMELKCAPAILLSTSILSFNRTFMELKFSDEEYDAMYFAF